MDFLEALRHKTTQSFARRSDLDLLEQRLITRMRDAESERERIDRDLDRARTDWPDWVINCSGSMLGAAGLGMMIVSASVTVFDMVATGGGALLTFWGGARFGQKRAAERALARRYDEASTRHEHLDEALLRVRRAKRRQHQ